MVGYWYALLLNIITILVQTLVPMVDQRFDAGIEKICIKFLKPHYDDLLNGHIGASSLVRRDGNHWVPGQGCRKNGPVPLIGSVITIHMCCWPCVVWHHAVTRCLLREVQVVFCELPSENAPVCNNNWQHSLSLPIEKITRSSPLWSQKTVTITFFTDGAVRHFLWGGDNAHFHNMGVSFVSWSHDIPTFHPL